MNQIIPGHLRERVRELEMEIDGLQLLKDGLKKASDRSQVNDEIIELQDEYHRYTGKFYGAQK